MSFRTWGNHLYTGQKTYDIVDRRNRWVVIAAVLMILSIAVLLVRGLNPGIEFSGGSQFTVSGAQTTEEQPAHDVISEVGGEPPRVSTVGDTTVRVQTGELTDVETRQVRDGLAEAYGVSPDDITSTFIGPTWGSDVTQQAIISLVIFISLIVLGMLIYFRTWTMAAAALAALLHDIVLLVGIYALVGFEITPAAVVGFLMVMGYSLYDTVVIFDKVRENNADLFTQDRHTYAEGSNRAVNQTLVRSINTSVTGVLPVAAILFIGALFMGAGTLRDIALALFVGMILSAYSSIYLAAPIEVGLRERDAKVIKHTKVVVDRRERRESGLKVASGPLSAERIDEEAALATERGGSVVAGRHLGTAAQPRRKKGGK